MHTQHGAVSGNIDASAPPRSRHVVLIGGTGDQRTTAGLAGQGLAVTTSDEAGLGSALADLDVAVVVVGGATAGHGADLAMVNRITRATDTPVIAAIEADRLSDRVVAFALGVADVIVVPFDPDELTARIGHVVERIERTHHHPAAAAVPAIVIDLTAREVLVEGRSLQLANREFELLAHLAKHPRRAFTREELLQAVWGSSAQWQDPATVTEHVRRIRAHLGRVDGASGSLQTVRGHGYRFVPSPGADDGRPVAVARPAYA